MLLTSQGFHTFTASKPLAIKHAEDLLDDFKKRRIKKGDIRIRPDYEKNKRDPFGHHWIIEYLDSGKGLTWNMRVCHSMSRDEPCNIRAIINPKVFAGIKDYLIAANSVYLERVEALFNAEAMEISPHHLGSFVDYLLTRIDYCLNIDVNELELPCDPDLMMQLIKRADIPPHYAEWTKYDTNSDHRKKSGQYSFYLKSKSVTVNYYWKYWQLVNEWPDCPDLEDSRNVIRLEIQFRPSKMYSMSKLIREKSGFSNLELKVYMLSDDFCADVIRRYFNRVIGRGDYYTLDGARQIVESKKFKPRKEQRLIADLKLISYCRGISKAKATLKDEERDDFSRSLRELEDIGVNPVTIPRERGVEHIPNLLNAYYNKRSDEQYQELYGERKVESLMEFHEGPNTKSKSKI